MHTNLNLLNRELKQQQQHQQWKRHLKINIWEMVIIASSSFIVDRECCKWTGRRAIEVNVEDERFTVVCSLCCWNLKFGNFTLFGRLCQRIVLKWVPNVQQDYFSSFNQSDHCIVVSSLLIPSSLLNSTHTSPWWHSPPNHHAIHCSVLGSHSMLQCEIQIYQQRLDLYPYRTLHSGVF